MPELPLLPLDDSALIRERNCLQLGLSVAATVCWIALALYLTLTSSLPRFLPVDLNATLGHFFLGLFVGGSLLCVVRAAAPGRQRLLVQAVATAGTAALFLLATELFQFLTPSRQPELRDAAADILGVAIVTGTLLALFRAGPQLAERTATGFTGFAIATATGVLATAAISPPVARSSAWPAKPGSDHACIRRFETLPQPLTRRLPPSKNELRPVFRPLAHFDLAADSKQSSGRLSPIVLDRSQQTIDVPGVGVLFRAPLDGLRSAEPVSDLTRTMASAAEFTVEAWIRPADTEQEGPTRVVTISSGLQPLEMNFHLGVENDGLSVRIRSSCQPNWFVVGRLSSAATHVAATYDRGLLSAYVDGHLVAVAELREADLDSWDLSYPLSIGNEATLERPYRGAISSVAFYDRALTGEQVASKAAEPDRRVALDGIDEHELSGADG